MARKARQATDALALQMALHERPEDFTLFEALRRIECAFPDRPRLGHSTRATDDAIRLCHTPSLSFSPRSIDRFETAQGTSAPRLHSLLLGLFGPNGPLPLHITEYAIDRQLNAKDSTLVAFANIFHHRLLSLFYRAWAESQPTVQYDRPDEDCFRTYIGALVGLATPHLQGRDALPDQYKRHFVGRLQSQARNAEGLVRFIESFFSISVRVIEFFAEWMRLPTDAHLHMSGGEMSCLGRTAVMGEYVRGAQHRFRLRLGPLSRAQFNHFLPGGEALKQLVAAVKTYVGEESAWDVQLVLKKEDVPLMHMGNSGRMGLSTWLGHFREDADADQVVLRPEMS